METVFIAMDTMREIEQLQIYTSGCTGTQKNSNAVGELIYEAGENCGIEMRETDLYPGAIDAEGFSRYGLEAAGFCGVNHDPRTYYHTRLDTPDNISEACINLSVPAGWTPSVRRAKNALSGATIKSFCRVPAVPALLRVI